MRFSGGKSHLAGKIQTLLQWFPTKCTFVEPFVGGCNIAAGTHFTNGMILSDISIDLVTLYQACLAGWVAPTTVTEAEYNYLRLTLEPSPLRTFVGYGCSFGGKWWGGYARGQAANGGWRNNADEGSRRLEGKFSTLRKLNNVRFQRCDYSTYNDLSDAVIYCDPPYLGTLAPGGQGDFSHVRFWEWVRIMSDRNYVLVSEQTAPDDFVAVRSWPGVRGIRREDGRPVEERIYCRSKALAFLT